MARSSNTIPKLVRVTKEPTDERKRQAWDEFQSMSHQDVAMMLAFLSGYRPALFVTVMDETRLDRESRHLAVVTS